MGNVELKYYTLQPDCNSTYLNKYKDVPVIAEPMSAPAMGLMMMLSTLQYQAPYMPARYINASSQAGRAAFIESGGQDFQNRLTSKVESLAKDAFHQVGITDTEMGAVLGAAKVVKDRQIDVNGPKIYFIRTHLTVGQDHGSVNMGFNF